MFTIFHWLRESQRSLPLPSKMITQKHEHQEMGIIVVERVTLASIHYRAQGRTKAKVEAHAA